MNARTVETLVLMVACMVVVGVFAVLRRRLTRNAIDMLRFDPHELALVALLVLLAPAWTLVARYIIVKIGDPSSATLVALTELVFVRPLSLEDLLLCVGGVLSMAVIEELFFRGLLLGFFVSRRSTAVGIIVSSLLFAASHSSVALVHSAYFFLGGLTFSFIAIRTGLIAAVIVHALCNLPRALEARLFIDGLDLVDPFTQRVSRADAEFYVLLLSVPFALYLVVRGLSRPRRTGGAGHAAT